MILLLSNCDLELIIENGGYYYQNIKKEGNGGMMSEKLPIKPKGRSKKKPDPFNSLS